MAPLFSCMRLLLVPLAAMLVSGGPPSTPVHTVEELVRDVLKLEGKLAERIAGANFMSADGAFEIAINLIPSQGRQVLALFHTDKQDNSEVFMYLEEPATVIPTTFADKSGRLVVLEAKNSTGQIRYFAIQFEEVDNGDWKFLEGVEAVMTTGDEAMAMEDGSKSRFAGHIKRVLLSRETMAAASELSNLGLMVLFRCTFVNAPELVIGIAKDAGIAGVVAIQKEDTVVNGVVLTVSVGAHPIWIMVPDEENKGPVWLRIVPFTMAERICDDRKFDNTCFNMVMLSYQDDGFSAGGGATIELGYHDGALAVKLLEEGQTQPIPFAFDVHKAAIKDNVLSIWLTSQKGYSPMIVFDIVATRMSLRYVKLVDPQLEKIATHLGLEGKLKDAFMRRRTFGGTDFSIETSVSGEPEGTFVLILTTNRKEQSEMALQGPATVMSLTVDAKRRSLVVLEGTSGGVASISSYFAILFEVDDGEWKFQEVVEAVMPTQDQAAKLAEAATNRNDSDYIKQVFLSSPIQNEEDSEKIAPELCIGSMRFLSCAFTGCLSAIGIAKKAGVAGVLDKFSLSRIDQDVLLNLSLGDDPILITIPEDDHLSWRRVLPYELATKLDLMDTDRRVMMASYKSIDFSSTATQGSIAFSLDDADLKVSIRDKTEDQARQFDFDVITQSRDTAVLYIHLKPQDGYYPMIVFDIDETRMKLQSAMLKDPYLQVALAVLGETCEKGSGTKFEVLYELLQDTANTFSSKTADYRMQVIDGKLSVHRSYKETSEEVEVFHIVDDPLFSMYDTFVHLFLPHASGNIDLIFDKCSLSVVKDSS
eukprot:GHVS01058553.1.p1 GENE.GHVS01058553.1~~GHVS01058553.1.p1  ORF type:complete len:817 (+),score=62.22 GHVS01058553.1:69-2519(+)